MIAQATLPHVRTGRATSTDAIARTMVAVAVLAMTSAALLLWRLFRSELGDGLVATMLVALVCVTLAAPIARLLRR